MNNMSILATKNQKQKSKLQKNQISLLIPVNFTVECLPENWRKDFDKACWWLNLIATKTCWRQVNHAGYVQLKAKYLREIIGDSQKALGEMLIEQGILLCDNHFDYKYQPKCRGFKLAEKFQGGNHRVTLTDPSILKKVKNKNRKKKRMPCAIYQHMADHLKKLEFNYAAALEHHDLRDLEPFFDKNGTLHHPDEQIIGFESIKEGSWNPSVCKYGRFHSELTHLKSDYKQYLHVNGQSLVEFDFKNSQLVMLYAIHNSYQQNKKCIHFGSYKYTRKTKGQIINFLKQEKEGEGEQGNTMRNVMLKSDSYADMSSSNDLEKMNANVDFGILVESGKLYDFVLEHCHCPSIKTRDDVKQQMFEQVLFGKKKGTISKIFQEFFPEIWETIQQLKKQDKNYLAHLLQIWESSIVYHRICQRIMLNHPLMPIFTIHDSLLTTPEYKNTLETIIYEEFSALGLSVTLKITDYAPETSKKALPTLSSRKDDSKVQSTPPVFFGLLSKQDRQQAWDDNFNDLKRLSGVDDPILTKIYDEAFAGRLIYDRY